MATRSNKTASTAVAQVKCAKAPNAKTVKAFADAIHAKTAQVVSAAQISAHSVLQFALERARLPELANMSEDTYDKLFAPIMGEVIAQLPISASTKPLYKTCIKSQFLGASHGLASDKSFKDGAAQMRGMLTTMGVIAQSNKGAPKKGATPGSNKPDAKAPTTAQDNAPTTAPKSKVLTDNQYDAAIAAFVTTLGLTGSNVANVRQAFSPSDIDQTLRLLASTYG